MNAVSRPKRLRGLQNVIQRIGFVARNRPFALPHRFAQFLHLQRDRAQIIQIRLMLGKQRVTVKRETAQRFIKLRILQRRCSHAADERDAIAVTAAFRPII